MRLLEKDETDKLKLYDKDAPKKRKFYDTVFVLAYICAMIPGPLPQLGSVCSIAFIACIAISFFDENFYLYAAIFMYMRFQLLIGSSPVYRIYSYLVVIRFLKDFTKIKFRVAYLPAIFVFLLHSLFATSKYESLRIGLNVIVDVVICYLLISRVAEDKNLFRKFIFVFIMGGILSGIYGWTNTSFEVDMHVHGAGAHTVSRNYGVLSDSNYAGLFYSLCCICIIVLKGLPLWLRGVLLAMLGLMLLQTASLSAIITLILLCVFWVILKYRGKSVIILGVAFIAIVILMTVLLSVPQFRQIKVIEGLIIRVTEKMSYFYRGRWDLLTTDRFTIWQKALAKIEGSPLWQQLIGGNVVTVTTRNDADFYTACHNSYLQSILDFGIVGTLIVYIPMMAVFAKRLLHHFTSPPGYPGEDIGILRLSFTFAFIVFGATVDFFIDWTFMMLYFF